MVAAPPAVIFALLTDPAEHVTLDGIGAVHGVVEAPDQLQLGSVFRMQMKGYKTTNTVATALEQTLSALETRFGPTAAPAVPVATAERIS